MTLESVASFASACLAAGFVILALSVLVSTTISAWRSPR